MRKPAPLFLAAILLVASGAFAQHPASSGDQPAAMPPMDCQSMMQEMQNSSKTMDDKLQQLIDEMNKSRGSSKVDRMAAVITELASQRKQMREQMMNMMPKMMKHMTQHMHSGMMSGMSQSMAGCPMMKGAEKAPEPPAGEHKH